MKKKPAVVKIEKPKFDVPANIGLKPEIVKHEYCDCSFCKPVNNSIT